MVYVLGGQDFENGIFDPISCSKSADRSAVLNNHYFANSETFTKRYFTLRLSVCDNSLSLQICAHLQN